MAAPVIIGAAILVAPLFLSKVPDIFNTKIYKFELLS
jgi:hypothetical protein